MTIPAVVASPPSELALARLVDDGRLLHSRVLLTMLLGELLLVLLRFCQHPCIEASNAVLDLHINSSNRPNRMLIITSDSVFLSCQLHQGTNCERHDLLIRELI